MVKELVVQDLKAYGDPQLVLGHIKSDYKAQEENMIKYFSKVKDLSFTFRSFEVQQIPRKDDSRADLLSRSVITIPMALPRSLC